MGKREQRQRIKAMSFKRSGCALACTLDLISDKWTLLVIRDLFFNKTRYKELQESAENIPTNILANRLQHLEKAGLISRTAYQERLVRYEYKLTDTGRSLGPVFKAMVNWARQQMPTRQDNYFFSDARNCDLLPFLAFFAARFSFKDRAGFFMDSLLPCCSFVMFLLRIRDE